MIAAKLPFPEVIPDAYLTIENERAFDPKIHLALEAPRSISELTDFGYDEATRAQAPSQLATTGALRVLSEAGVAAMRESALAIRERSLRTEGDPRAAYIKPRGCLYISKFMRDFCYCAEVLEFFSEIAGTPLAPHTMPTMAAGPIYAPPEVAKTNQGWHLDIGAGFSCIIGLSDPGRLEGGRTQYFRGTRTEVADLCRTTVEELRVSVGNPTEMPPERVVSVGLPAAGYGVFFQGNLVVHRGEPLSVPAERIMFAPGFIALDLSFPDVLYWQEARRWNSPALTAEYARHKAWRARTKLDAVIQDLPIDSDPQAYRRALEDAAREILDFTEELKRSDLG